MSVLVHLQSKGYAKTTLEGVSKKLRQLERHTDLSPERVLAYINAQRNSNTKNLLANACNHYAVFYKIQWEKPKYCVSDSPIKCPLEENLDYIIKTARSLKRKVAFGIIKDDEFTVRTAKTVQEATALIEVGFDYVMEIDGLKVFRKPK